MDKWLRLPRWKQVMSLVLWRPQTPRMDIMERWLGIRNLDFLFPATPHKKRSCLILMFLGMFLFVSNMAGLLPKWNEFSKTNPHTHWFWTDKTFLAGVNILHTAYTVDNSMVYSVLSMYYILGINILYIVVYRDMRYVIAKVQLSYFGGKITQSTHMFRSDGWSTIEI